MAGSSVCVGSSGTLGGGGGGGHISDIRHSRATLI
jgi:hypothetical protein